MRGRNKNKRTSAPPPSLALCRFNMKSHAILIFVGFLVLLAFVGSTLNLDPTLQVVARAHQEILQQLEQPTTRTTTTTMEVATWTPKSKARFCDPGTILDKELMKSQEGEDRDLINYFHNLCEGTYIEMGALNGVTYSNTHVFHFGLQWKGVLVEASPRNYKELIENRKNEIATVHAGACAEARPLHWVEGSRPAVGGFMEFTTKDFQDRWFTKEAIQNAAVVNCKPLKDILLETVGPRFHFDLFSLDVEGAEYSALASLDFNQVSFGIILVESDANSDERKNIAVRALIQRNGYIFLKEHRRSYWFAHQDFADIYKDLIHK
mmetsp:Transcript_33819/g.52701  ORF Transcript_33819/g.52701 Transcript_33819/m.52701 type:complete len:322 (+) Transcript_33819:233-1198(+)